MSFCIKDRQLFNNGKTIVDNKFLVNYLPDAPDNTIKVYLLGLALANDNSNNEIQDIASKLSLTEQEVIETFYYWEEQGLVHITNSNPQQIVYLSSDGNSTTKKIKSNKYAKFSKEMQRIVSGRMLSINEYNEYYIFLENNLFQPEALLAIAEYCTQLKGNDITYQYILTVAHNQLRKGATTLTAVADNLATNSKHDQDIPLVSKALGVRGKIDHDQRELIDKWFKMGYSLDTIVKLAKKNKGTSYSKLDRLLQEYYAKGAMSITEIDSYIDTKAQLYDTARLITKTIGVYYQSLDMVVEEYVSKWVLRGYDQPTLATIAKYCFRSGTRTLAGLDKAVDKMYRLGLTTDDSINAHLSRLLATDKNIARLLDLMSLERIVTNNDRVQYRIWTTQWNMPQELIEYACTKCVGTTQPMQYLNKILSNYKQGGITTIAQAEAQQYVSSTVTKTKQDHAQHEYTDQEIGALFTDLDNVEI